VDSASTLEPASGHEKLAAHRLPVPAVGHGELREFADAGATIAAQHKKQMPPRVASAGEILFQGVILESAGFLTGCKVQAARRAPCI